MNIKSFLIEKWEGLKKWSRDTKEEIKRDGLKSYLKKRWKRILVVAGATTILTASVLAPTPIPVLSFNVDGQNIEVAYTDDNTDEDLIIRTNQKDYLNLGGNITIYFSVLNTSGKDQEIKTVFSFQDSSGDKKFVKNIEEYAGETITENIIPAYWEHSTTGDTFIATTTQQIEKTLWQEHTLNDFNVQAVSVITRKDIKKTHSLKENTFLLAKDETKFFRARIAYTDFQGAEQIFQEVFGDKGGYGHLQ